MMEPHFSATILITPYNIAYDVCGRSENKTLYYFGYSCVYWRSGK